MLRIDQNIFFWLDEIKVKCALNLQSTTDSFIFEPADKTQCLPAGFRNIIMAFLTECRIFDCVSFSERRLMAIGTKTNETGLIKDVLDSGHRTPNPWNGQDLEGLGNPKKFAQYLQAIEKAICIVSTGLTIDITLYKPDGEQLEFEKYL